MKNMADVESMLMLELKHWFNRQSENIYSDYYFYYLPTTAEHDGGFTVCSQPPANPEFILVQGRINKGATVEQNFNHFREVFRRLPILSTR